MDVHDLGPLRALPANSVLVSVPETGTMGPGVVRRPQPVMPRLGQYAPSNTTQTP